MGQKIRPDSLRIGITKGWSLNWFPKKSRFKDVLEEGVLLRKLIEEKIKLAGIDKINIDRIANNYKISVRVARPGLVIGRGGKGIEDLTKLLENKIRKLRRENKINEPVFLNLNIEEVKRHDVSARVVAQNIAWDLEKRLPFRRILKRNLDQILQNKNIKGAKIMVSGRLGGSEIARTEHLEQGKLPLQTLRADIDYGQVTAFTTYGTIGVKVWVYKGEVFNHETRNTKHET